MTTSQKQHKTHHPAPLPKRLVADLLAAGYNPTSIAAVLGVTPERIRQIRGRLRMTPPRARSWRDLPPELQAKVIAYLHPGLGNVTRQAA